MSTASIPVTLDYLLSLPIPEGGSMYNRMTYGPFRYVTHPKPFPVCKVHGLVKVRPNIKLKTLTGEYYDRWECTKCKHQAEKSRRVRGAENYKRKNDEWYKKYYNDKFVGRMKYYKENKPCTDCGLSYPYYVMEFDHVRGIKKKNVSALWCASIQLLEEEIAKCDLVCANCHNIRTYKRGRGLI